MMLYRRPAQPNECDHQELDFLNVRDLVGRGLRKRTALWVLRNEPYVASDEVHDRLVPIGMEDAGR
jgi:hypothetical protein